MPNNITNEISFGTGDQAKTAFQQMLEEMREPGEELGSFDFNRLIPMPESLNIVAGTQTKEGLELYKRFIRDRDNPPADFIEKWKKIAERDPETWDLGKRAYCNIQDHGAPTWYEWCVKNWGTKWNAYRTELDMESGTLSFETAWSSVPKIVELLSQKYPEQNICYRWADEDIGYNVGECTYRGGVVTKEHIPTPGSREAYEMAAEIMGIELEDFDLVLSADGSTYEYMDNDSEPEVSKQPKSRDQER